ncbi:hypothetical protein PAXRUDRAFT_142537 [Paxillus rubicundulus Ve08.2h10]|uniref:Uncharacterized protein n=1 Tax=Paxillus rubicundulus Ve08.2h10 TaxID=930991 RepID=A0A0D0DX51_9AGAM|nr:hypothetical protein PAXRUDRAFT_142537 [Paxillus rubicundulus Ve08.2h10]
MLLRIYTNFFYQLSKPPGVEYTYSMSPYSSSPELAFQPNSAQDYEKPIYMPSPLATITSSLTGWNGEFGPPSPSASAYTASSQGDVPSLKSSSPRPVADGVRAPPDRNKGDYTFQPEPVIATSADAFDYSNYIGGGNSPYEDLERARALEAYAIGLESYDLFSCPVSFPEYSSIDLSLEEELAALFPEQLSGS